MYRNNGDGTFTDVADGAGVRNDRYAKGAAWGDYDGDNDLDLYVSNFGGENRLYRNNGDGTFTDVAREMGVTEPFVSFSCGFLDFDNDGRLDIFVIDYAGNLNDYVASALGQPSPNGSPPSAVPEHRLVRVPRRRAGGRTRPGRAGDGAGRRRHR